ncbi:MAG: hypothetical protein IH621_10800, partial [Krumholzibacteria bacterium]|nr:hypothetical protein [Candidatus Krumholzibacteria bacterium]
PAPRRVSAALDAGPEVAWSGLGGSQSSWTGETASWGDTWLLGLAARLAPAAPGLQPFASVGLGWYKREDSLLGLSLGAGLRWHRAGGGGLDCELRWHSSPSGSEDVPAHGQWTVAAGWTFGI